MDGSSTEFGLRAARKLIEATDQEWPAFFERLRRNRELSVVVRHLNQLLDHPEHRQLAIDALKRIGLWHEEVVMPRRMAVREFGCQPETEVVEVPTNDRLIDEMAHVLQMDEPMAGAGAVLSSLHVKSETEQALERAVSRYPL